MRQGRLYVFDLAVAADFQLPGQRFVSHLVNAFLQAQQVEAAKRSHLIKWKGITSRSPRSS